MWGWYISMLAVAALAAIAAWAIFRVFRYVTEIQEKYYALMEKLAAQGIATQPEIVRSSQFSDAALGLRPAAAMVDGPAQPAKTLQVKGPHILTIGVESSAFLATLCDPSNERQDPALDAKWIVTPAGAASVNPTIGSSVKVTPTQLGAFVLHVDAGSSATGTVEFSVATILPASKTVSIPFIGEGWGTIILAIFFGAAVALLGLSRAIDPALVGTLMGALLGYIFGFVSRSGSSGGPANGGGNKPAGNE